jgi:hypothetical protein
VPLHHPDETIHYSSSALSFAVPYLQNNAKAFRIHHNAMIVFIKEIRPDHTKHGNTTTKVYLFTMERLLMDLHRTVFVPVPETAFIYVTGQVKSGPHLTGSKHPNPLHQYPQGPGTIYRNSHEKLCPVLISLWVTCILHGRFSCIILQKDLLEICKSTMRHPAERPGLITAVTHLPFSGV